MSTPLLEVEDLRVTFPTATGPVRAVRGVSFTLGRERLGIVGESGSGKSVTGRSLLRLLPPHAKLEAKRLRFDGQDLLRATPREMRALRGSRISLVMQDPKYSLNPVMRVGEQIAEALRGKGPGVRRRVLEALEAVRIRDPERVYNLYPHEVSGGMGQRIMIAMMLAPEPDLLIADEPTSALDVTVQMQVLAILDDLVAKRGMGLIFISHDLDLVASFCDRVLVMYGGRVMEELHARDLRAATHPYTQGLLDSLPRIDDQRDELPTLRRDPAWLED
ncbi:MAG: ABC transporter ATP-binding protein [Alphaproteobacteria bacterium]|nr:ABC transporter ATP-binding protein [Alphaproteobacteria bacterium]